MSKNFDIDDLESMPYGTLLNNAKVAKILGVSAQTASAILKDHGIPTARLGKGKNASIYTKAGFLRDFLDRAFSNQNTEPPAVESPAAVPPPPPDDELDELYEIAMEAAGMSVICADDVPSAADENPPLEKPTPVAEKPPHAVELKPSAVVVEAISTPTRAAVTNPEKQPKKLNTEPKPKKRERKKGVKSYGQKF